MIVRISLWPDRALEVDAAEYLELQRQGLLLEAPASVPPIPPPASPPPAEPALTPAQQENNACQ